MRFYADDVLLFIDFKHLDQVSEALAEDLRRVEVWAGRWLLSFNPSKTDRHQDNGNLYPGNQNGEYHNRRNRNTQAPGDHFTIQWKVGRVYQAQTCS